MKWLTLSGLLIRNFFKRNEGRFRKYYGRQLVSIIVKPRLRVLKIRKYDTLFTALLLSMLSIIMILMLHSSTVAPVELENIGTWGCLNGWFENIFPSTLQKFFQTALGSSYENEASAEAIPFSSAVKSICSNVAPSLATDKSHPSALLLG